MVAEVVRWLNSGPEGGRRENDNVVLRSIMGVVTEYQCVHAAFSIVYIYPSVLQDVRRSGGEWGEFPDVGKFRRPLMQDVGYELPRISLPETV
jgi:hypothetical protein